MAIQHKFKKGKSLFSTTLVGAISTGTGETIELASVTGLPTDTEITLTLDRIDANGDATPTKMERITGVIAGSYLTDYTRGTDGSTEQAHSVGAVIEYIFNAQDLNDQVDGLLAEHSQAGAHTADVISEKTGAAGVTVDGVKLKDSEVYTDVIKEKTAVTGVTVDGVKLKDDDVYADQIFEKTSGAGIEFGHPWKSSAQPCFAVTKDDAQVITKATFTKLQLNDEEFDQGSNYDAVTNYRFTVPTDSDGKYVFHATASIAALADTKLFIIALYKNGSEVRRGHQTYVGGAGTHLHSVSALLDLVATDYIEVWIYHGDTVNRSTDATAEVNHFQGWKVA